MTLSNFFAESKRRNVFYMARLYLVAFCRKISEGRYQFRRWTVLVATTPPPGPSQTISHAAAKYREILVPFAARSAKWVMTDS